MVMRGLILFAVIAVLSAVAAWFAETPGNVAIAWRGWRIDTTFAVLLLVVAVIAVVVALLYRFWRAIVHTPQTLARMRRERRQRKGYEALTRGLVAVAAGDPEEARRQASAADARLDEPPLTLLLSAQAAQLEGREAAARDYFTAMLDRHETEFLGLRGLIIQAERAGDSETALTLTRRAHRLRPRTGWVLTALFEKEAAAGNWSAAERLLRDAMRYRALPGTDAHRHHASVLLQQALAKDMAGDSAGALKLARKALDEQPTFRAAAADLAERTLAAGKHRQAVKLVERLWPEVPHPDLARVYGTAVQAKDPLRRFQAMERLAALNPDHPESCLALARAALEARLWGEARRHLQAIPEGPARTARVYRLMAEVEDAENGSTPELRAWLARAADAPPDPGWVCGSCGAVAPGWHAICGNCGAFGEIDWRTPPRAMAEIELPEVEAEAELPAPAPEAEVIAEEAAVAEIAAPAAPSTTSPEEAPAAAPPTAPAR
ncbi:MAG: heme biosynthesis HemY N-terminal domain-containing protein [Alphaproteobacteria bacterium]|nr:heme biosynthesis HemY N-terminal domain-containing protein [Alphaproteobacteria bacterium]